jgi:non-specific serine/threonine protein kinase
VLATSARLPEPLTSFIGREQEVDELLALLRRPEIRLVTITGPGGVGKTRLALRIASEFASTGEREVLFVGLSSIDDASIVVPTIGQALGVKDTSKDPHLARLAEAIGERNPVLLLDNFERLVNAAPLLTALLVHCRLLTILITSRVLLRVSGEYSFPVHPLDLPSQNTQPGQIGQSPAVRLFQDRLAAAGERSISATQASELPVVAEICRRLDGLPLAIELAAAKTRVFSVSELQERLQLGTVHLGEGPRDAPPRLRSMHDAVAWSYDLLTDEEQMMFRVLSVFSGGFTFESADELFRARLDASDRPLRTPEVTELAVGDPAFAIGIVSSLIEQSLIERMASLEGKPRFTMLETIREFGRERLAAAGEEQLVQKMHAAWFATRSDRIETDRTHLALDSDPDPLVNEQGNLRAAITWALKSGEGETAAWLAYGLWPFLGRYGHYSEARAMLQNVLGAPGLNDPVLRACLLLYSAKAAWCQGDFQDCRELAMQALALCRKIDHQAGIATSLFQLGDAALAGDLDQAISLYRNSLDVSRALDDAIAVARALDGLGWAMMYAGDHTEAKAAFTEHFLLGGDPTGARCLFNPLAWVALAEGDFPLAKQLAGDAAARSREMGVAFTEACSLRLLARAAFFGNELLAAADSYRQALTLDLQIGAHHEAGYCVAELAAVALSSGEPEQAARWLGFEEAHRERQRLRLSPDESELRNRTRELALAALGDDSFSAAWNEGRHMPAAIAFAEARGWHPRLPATQARNTALTRRELEVLEYLAAGRTNQQIAEHLFLGKRTIDTHVSNLLAKLGVDSRIAAVREAQDRGLISR